MGKRLTKKAIRIWILTAALVVAVGISLPFLIQWVKSTPQYSYYRLTALVRVIEKRQIYWQEGDDPLLYAYQAYFETEEEPSEKEIRNAFVDVLKEDGEGYYTLANLMLSWYDVYSKLVSNEQYARLYPDNENYGGLGIVISEYGPFVRIADVYPQSAAGAAGIQAGDLIAYVNGEDIRALSYSDASARITEVAKDSGTLGILREGEEDILTFTLQGEEVVIPNVDWEIWDEIAYLNITLFSGNDFKSQVDNAFADFKKAGVKKLILDLRDNRGGSINLLTYLLDALTSEPDVLMFTELKRENTIEHYSKGRGMAFEDVAVLINAGTCSSAEVCAGYMKDRGYSVIGTVSYGKGTGLSILDFYGDVLVIATIDIVLPLTGGYNGEGIYPTKVLEQAYRSAQLPEMADLAMDTEIDSSSEAADVYALEERLFCLGYIFTAPDGSWDAETAAAAAALNVLADEADALGEGVTRSALVLLDEMLSRLYDARVLIDTQMEAAVSQLNTADGLAA